MNARLQALKPIPLTFLLILLSLSVQVELLSSTTTTISPGTEARTVHSFGLGSPIRIISVSRQSAVSVNWAGLSLNLIGTYFVSAVLGTTITKMTRLRKPTTAYGLLTLSVIG